MIRNISQAEFVVILENHLRFTGKVKPNEEFKFVGFDPKNLDKFFQIEISKKEE